MSIRHRITTIATVSLSMAAIAAPAAARPPYPVAPVRTTAPTSHDTAARYVTDPLTGHQVLADVASTYNRQDKQMITPGNTTPQPTVQVRVPSSSFGTAAWAAVAAAAVALLLLLGSAGMSRSRRARRPALSH